MVLFYFKNKHFATFCLLFNFFRYVYDRIVMGDQGTFDYRSQGLEKELKKHFPNDYPAIEK